MNSIPKSTWKLKRFGRFLLETTEGSNPWKVFESSASTGELMLTLVESGHMLVSRGQELLDGLSLTESSNFLKVQHKADTLLFRVTVKGESRLMRMQFDGNSRPAAMEECASAVIRLEKYFPVITEAGTVTLLNCPPQINQPHMEPCTPGEKTGDVLEMAAESEDAPGSLPIKHLAQHFLGQRDLSLPLVYNNWPLPQGDLEPFLRLCLLDPSFPALVEDVERELNKVFKK